MASAKFSAALLLLAALALTGRVSAQDVIHCFYYTSVTDTSSFYDQPWTNTADCKAFVDSNPATVGAYKACSVDFACCSSIVAASAPLPAYGCADPHFRGFSGAWYDVNGFPDAVFNVFSSPDYQVNAHFSNLGNAKVINNYMTRIGFLTPAGGSVVEVGLEAGSLVLWQAKREGANLAAAMQTGVAYRLNEDTVARVTKGTPSGKEGTTVALISKDVAVKVFRAADEGWLDISVELLTAAFPDPHGIVGQTWRGGQGVPPPVVNGSHVLEGEGDADYEVTDGILGAKTKFGMFAHATFPDAKPFVPATSTGMSDGDVTRRFLREGGLRAIGEDALPAWAVASVVAAAEVHGF